MASASTFNSTRDPPPPPPATSDLYGVIDQRVLRIVRERPRARLGGYLLVVTNYDDHLCRLAPVPVENDDGRRRVEPAAVTTDGTVLLVFDDADPDDTLGVIPVELTE